MGTKSRLPFTLGIGGHVPGLLVEANGDVGECASTQQMDGVLKSSFWKQIKECTGWRMKQRQRFIKFWYLNKINVLN